MNTIRLNTIGEVFTRKSEGGGASANNIAYYDVSMLSNGIAAEVLVTFAALVKMGSPPTITGGGFLLMEGTSYEDITAIAVIKGITINISDSESFPSEAITTMLPNIVEITKEDFYNLNTE